MLQESAVTKSVHSCTLIQNLRLKIAHGMIGVFVNMVSVFLFLYCVMINLPVADLNTFK